MGRDELRFCLRSLTAQRLRSFLSVLGIAIGVASVILLTTLGEGTKRYVLGQFTQFGTNILGVHPGKTETHGMPGVLGGSTRKLTLDDAEALRRVQHIEDVMPIAVGQAAVEAGNRSRSVFIYGATEALPRLFKFGVAQGSFLPAGDSRQGASVAVLGPKLARELFGEVSPLGRSVRVAGARLRVIGVMAAKGQVLGQDLDDIAYIPVATALRLFNLEEVTEIDVIFTHERVTDEVAAEITRLLKERHGGEEDFTIVTQKAMLEVFGKVMNAITYALAAIGAISLLVGAIGILTMMWIAVSERTDEIGLLRALGATSRQVLRLFLIESALLATLGGIVGLSFGLGVAALARVLVPGLPLHTPPELAVAAVVVSGTVGLLAGALPARRAAALDPIEALRAE